MGLLLIAFKYFVPDDDLDVVFILILKELEGFHYVEWLDLN